jgi:hypothetical protein
MSRKKSEWVSSTGAELVRKTFPPLSLKLAISRSDRPSSTLLVMLHSLR